MEKVNTHSLLDNPSLIGSFQYKANTCLWNKATSSCNAFVKNMISSSRADISLSKIHQKVHLWIPSYDLYSLDTLLWLLHQIFKRSRARNSEVNNPILLKIKPDWDFMPVLDICEIEADLRKIEAATVMTKFFSS